MKIKQYRSKLDKLKGRREWLEKNLETSRCSLIKLTKRLHDIEKAQVFVQNVAQSTQEKLKYHIEDIVQLALDAVFPQEYEFCVNFEIKRGKTEARMSFMKHGQEIDPLDSAGGGVADITAFALRLVVWSLGESRPLIVLDEPFRYLSRDLQPRAGDILKKLSKRLKLQILMVSHNEDMIRISDRIFKVKMKEFEGWKKSVISDSGGNK